MLARDKIMEMATYCHLVFRQLSWLYANSSISTADYARYLQASSLALGEDGFIMARLVDACRIGDIEETLRELIAFYEGMTFALVGVLGIGVTELEKQISPELIKKLAQEVGVGC